MPVAVSPSLARRAPGRVAASSASARVEASPSLSPSILGAIEPCAPVPPDDVFLLPTAAALAAAAPTAAARATPRAAGRVSTAQPVPDSPPPRAPPSAEQPLLQQEAAIAADEGYGADERALNDFLTLHPMLSMGKLEP